MRHKSIGKISTTSKSSSLLIKNGISHKMPLFALISKSNKLITVVGCYRKPTNRCGTYGCVSVVEIVCHPTVKFPHSHVR